ncbi:hypothetical protein [Janthinobacterium sp. 64]|uniref:hypothetical protein n=1 Tax=Janthinobacterium sp. 64 TaxID=2035208 RepID=UPI000C2BB800|nr:hypothetical protein [Janthinobacterium sp. 64]PKB20243.1 hypothetical protein CLU91_0581 [Janthinobacterium sp. 64]
MILRLIVLLITFAVHTCSTAASDQQSAPARIGQVVIDVPMGLNGPDRTSPNPSSELHVYFSQKGIPPTILQLTRVVTPEARPDITEKVRYEAATHFLKGFLHTFSTNVQGWQVSSIEQVKVGVNSMARAKWSGSYHGIPTQGEMYLLVLGKEGYCFHTFGQSNVQNDTLKLSVKAINELRVDNGK